MHAKRLPTLGWRRLLSGGLLLSGLVACGPAPGVAIDPEIAEAVSAVPVYDRDTGRLERLESDRNGDGQTDAVALMDGAHIRHVEIDRDFDGVADRWEYYVPNPSGEPGPGSPDGRNLLDRAEERAGPEQPVSRREQYRDGVIALVEEDTDADGRFDKWEHYGAGRLQRVEFDFDGNGFPSRRLVYGPTGTVVRVEVDPDGDGHFVAATTAAPGTTPGSGSGAGGLTS